MPREFSNFLIRFTLCAEAKSEFVRRSAKTLDVGILEKSIGFVVAFPVGPDVLLIRESFMFEYHRAELVSALPENFEGGVGA